MERYLGLEYLSYHDPGRDFRGHGSVYGEGSHFVVGSMIWSDFGGLFTRSLDYCPISPSHTRVGKRTIVEGRPYTLPEDASLSLRTYHEERGMYYPDPRCKQCKQSRGRAVCCIQHVPVKCLRQTAFGALDPYNIEYIEGAVSVLRSHLPNSSPAWPIDAPNWRLSQNGNAHFITKWMGQAFFVCHCRANPVSYGAPGHYWQQGRFQDKQVFYRCPYLNTAVDADQPPEVSEFIEQLGVGSDEAEEALQIALG